eukprot:3932313-Rhodomonas_salina.1
MPLVGSLAIVRRAFGPCVSRELETCKQLLDHLLNSQRDLDARTIASSVWTLGGLRQTRSASLNRDAVWLSRDRHCFRVPAARSQKNEKYHKALRVNDGDLDTVKTTLLVRACRQTAQKGIVATVRIAAACYCPSAASLTQGGVAGTEGGTANRIRPPVVHKGLERPSPVARLPFQRHSHLPWAR